MVSRLCALLLTVLPCFVMAEAAAKQPELYVDCSFTGPAGDLCKESAEAWAKEKKVKINVERRTMTSSEKLERYTKLLAAKSPKFDVFGVDVIWPGVLHKHLLNLRPHFEGKLGEYLPLYIENNTVNGRLLAIPFNVGVGLLYYRKDLMEKHKLAVPQTWQELTGTAAEIQKREREAGNKDFWGFAFQGRAYEGLTCNALEWIASHNGGNILDNRGRVLVNTTNVLTALNMASKWVGTISPPEVLGFAETESHQFFQNGKAAFLRAWPSAWSVVGAQNSPLAGKVGVAVLPKGGAQGIHASTLGGWSIAISAYTKHPQLAADLIRHLTSASVQKKGALTAGNTPTMTKLYEDPEIAAYAPYYPILLPVLSKAALRPSRITRSSYPEMSERFWKSMHTILSGKANVLEEISRLQSDLEQLARRWRR